MLWVFFSKLLRCSALFHVISLTICLEKENTCLQQEIKECRHDSKIYDILYISCFCKCTNKLWKTQSDSELGIYITVISNLEKLLEKRHFVTERQQQSNSGTFLVFTTFQSDKFTVKQLLHQKKTNFKIGCCKFCINSLTWMPVIYNKSNFTLKTSFGEKKSAVIEFTCKCNDINLVT